MIIGFLLGVMFTFIFTIGGLYSGSLIVRHNYENHMDLDLRLIDGDRMLNRKFIVLSIKK